MFFFFFFQAEDGIRDVAVTGVQTCALPICPLNQRGLPSNPKGGHPHVIPQFAEAPLMRLSVGSLRQVVKRDLPIEFVAQQLTSYGGLELFRRYARRLSLLPRLRRACAPVGGDYCGARLSLLLLALFYVGARRVEHLKYLVGDPLVRRFCGLARLPTARTVTNWLRRFSHHTLRPLLRLNEEVVLDTLARLQLPRLTLDVDGTVVRTGATVGWAFRGVNPHHRKDPSYYPLLAHVAQTGHILRLKNRPGNVHDSKQATAFLRAMIDRVRARLGHALRAPARVPHGRGVFPARCPAAAHGSGLRLRHQGRVLELAAPQTVGGGTLPLAAPGARCDGLRALAHDPAVATAPASDDLPQACPARKPQELQT